MGKKITILVLLFLISLVCFTAVVKADEDKCEVLKERIGTLLDQANYCDLDSDCIITEEFSTLGCFHFLNKNADLTPIRETVRKHQEEGCPIKVAMLCYTPELENIKCKNNKCIDILYSASEDSQAELSSPFSIEITEQGMLEIGSKISDEIEIELYLTHDFITPGPRYDKFIVSKDKPYKSTWKFIDWAVKDYISTTEDNEGRAKLTITYSYKGKHYKENVVWDISIPKESLGEAEVVFSKDGSQSVWFPISRFTATKTSHEVEEITSPAKTSHEVEEITSPAPKRP